MENSENNEEIMLDEPVQAEKQAEDSSPKKSSKGKKKGGMINSLKAEFHRIVWPDKDTIIKETTAVVISTIILGIIIALLDLLIKTGLDKIFQLG